jgi:hypothetical protein
MKKLYYFVSVFIVSIILLFYFDIIWKSPSYYKTETITVLEVPVMDMTVYMDSIINTHRRPYIFTIESSKRGKVVAVGVEHMNDQTNSQFDSISHFWELNKPTVALVEGRLGFYIKWLHNPIERFGESGLTAELAKKDRVDLYTWEPTREDEIELLIKQYSAQKLAMFYSLRPFFGTPPQYRSSNPEENLQDLIDERTNKKHLKNTLTSWKDIDSIWKADFPNKDWRTFNSGYGYPGYLHDIWNSSNLARDEHMINIIIELVNKGETVFITMGSSHAPRIEESLKKALK